MHPRLESDIADATRTAEWARLSDWYKAAVYDALKKGEPVQHAVDTLTREIARELGVKLGLAADAALVAYKQKETSG